MKTDPDFSKLTAEAQRRVDDVCDAFEAAWQQVAALARTSHASTPAWPEIGLFVKEFTRNERAAALQELVPIDVSYRRQSGAAVAIGEYTRFTELDAEWLAEIVLNPDGATRRVPASNGKSMTATSQPKLPPPTREVFLERLVASGVLDRRTVELEIVSVTLGDTSAITLGERLVSRGLLTPFQLNSLLRTAKPGLVLGEYIILSPLGRGGMGAVYKARHRRMDRLVALKVLPPAAAHDPQMASRFSREIRAVARLSHPNIVAAHDAGEDSGVAYLVMECIDGTDLSSCVRTHGPLSVAHAVECVAQAAEGLEYAHRQGVIHRDIKPSNLILCHDREVVLPSEGECLESVAQTTNGNSPHTLAPAALRLKVLDLGLARFNADAVTTQEGSALTHTGVMFGTPEYMSPEQAVNASTADARSDIYSLGCTLYFLLTGRTVVVGQSFLETVMAHQLQALPSLIAARHDVPAELEQVFRRMTARKADQRFGSMQEVREALRAIPGDQLSCTASPVIAMANMAVPLTHELTEGRGGSTDWLGPLAAADQEGEATVLFTNFDAPTRPRHRWSLRSRLVEWVQSNRSASIALAVGLSLLLITGVASWWMGTGQQQELAGKQNSGRSGVAPQPALPPKPLRPEPLSCPADLATVQRKQHEWAKYLGVESELVKNSLGITLCLIPPGEFTMGTTDAEFDALPGLNLPPFEIQLVRNERPGHRVRLTKPFWISQTEVTVGQFRQFVEAAQYETEAEQTEGFGYEDNRWVLSKGYSWKAVGEAPLSESYPASNITWNDAVAFCDWLSRHESSKSGQTVRYRLPTEAEWEYACRAGTETPWYFGSDLEAVDRHAVYARNSRGFLHAVGTKSENPFHLFDVSGNQAEWCQDWLAPYGGNLAVDPTGPLNGELRVQRGGNFGSQATRIRSAAREGRLPSSPKDGSLRVVREVVEN